MKFSPALFLIIEFFILIPVVLLNLGVILSFLHNRFLFEIVISKSQVRNIFILIVCPLSGGFLAYQYLERYGPQGLTKKITKGILAYTIIELGLAIAFVLFGFMPR